MTGLNVAHYMQKVILHRSINLVPGNDWREIMIKINPVIYGLFLFFLTHAAYSTSLTGTPGVSKEKFEIIYNICAQPLIEKRTCSIRYSRQLYEKMIIAQAHKKSKVRVNRLSHGINFKNEFPHLIAIFDKMVTRISESELEIIVESLKDEGNYAIDRIRESAGPEFKNLIDKLTAREALEDNSILKMLMEGTAGGINFLFKSIEEIMNEENKVLQTQLTFESDCKRVLCAVKEIYGREIGPRLLYIFQKYGLNGSHLAFENSIPWTEEELDVLIMALEDLPGGLLPIISNKPLVRKVKPEKNSLSEDENETGRKTRADSRFNFYDPWWESNSEYEKMAVFTHEIGHYVSIELNLVFSDEWLSLSGWYDTTPPPEISRGEIEGLDIEFPDWFSLSYLQYLMSDRSSNYLHSEDACFLSDYSKENPHEDFAETFVAYRYMPEILRNRCRGKYDFIKENVFGGMEFTSKKQFCKLRPELGFDIRSKKRYFQDFK